MHFWIDVAGRLWKGTVCPDENLHYAHFCGYMQVAPFDEIWVASRSSPSEYWVELEPIVASRIMTGAKRNRKTPGEVLFDAMAKHQSGTCGATIPAWEYCKEKDYLEAVARECGIGS